MDRVGDSICRIAYRRHDTHDHDFTVVARTLAACNSGRVVRVLRSPLLWILLAYYLLSAVTLVVWDARGVYLPTGDEPHYLVIADALVADRSLDVSTAYRREIDEPRWFASGLADPGSPLAPPAAHVVTTDTGFSASTNTPILSGVFGLAVLLPNLAVTARRLHDRNMSGWWMLAPYGAMALAFLMGAINAGILAAASGIGAFVLVIVLFVMLILKGTDGPNRFGPDPLGGGGGHDDGEFAASRMPPVGRDG